MWSLQLIASVQHSIAVISTAPQQFQTGTTKIKFLDTVEGMQGNIWEVKVMKGDKVILCKVDTGVEVIVLSKKHGRA